ncbi:MAG: PQQ-binding-like beta-propeller repeat protein [Betaproteobacteria bacterium]
MLTKNRAVTTVMIILLLFSIASVFVTTTAKVEQVGAPQLTPWPTAPPTGVTPSVTIPTTAFISVSPNPIGQGQTVLVNIWLEPPIAYQRFFSGYTITVTKPDSTTETIGPLNSYQGDATAWVQYSVDQVGTYKFKFTFAGNYLQAGWYYNGNYYATQADLPAGVSTGGMGFGGAASFQSAWYQGSTSPEVSLTVQQELVYSWPAAQLPTDYWTRPIPIENREWWIIGGQFPFTGVGGGEGWPANTNPYASNYKFTPYVQAPNTAHIAWMRQGALAGIVGGQFGYSSVGPGESTYAGTPNIIFQGRAYQTITKPMTTTVNGVTVTQSTNVWQCYDIRTGQVYWEQTGITQPPTVVTFNAVKSSVPGAEQTGMGTNTYSLVYIGSSRMIKYNPWTGAATLNISLPVSSGTMFQEPYAYSVSSSGGKNWLIKWDTTGTSTDFNTRIISNVTYPFTSLGTVDYEAGVAVSTASITPPGAGHTLGQRIMGASLSTGQLLWNVTSDDIFFPSTLVADHGKVTTRVLGGWWDCWNLQTGQLVWQTAKPGETGGEEYPWGDFGAYTIASYGGLIYDFSYAGFYAIDWETGKIAWHYSTPAMPFESATYPSMTLFSNSPQIADGKLYYANGEHSPTQPLARGWRLWCLNATTGEYIWDINGGGTAGAVADGYLTYDNRYDGYMYVFGKGPSQTTVSAPQTSITAGNTAIISGTILDQSPAQPGAACVSKESMSTYMEFLHQQRPIDGFFHNVTVTGVPVTITVNDPNDNWFNLGTVMSDEKGNFGFSWTPTIAGQYKITATFAGDDSYGSSWATTYATVNDAPQATPTQAPIRLDETTNTLMMAVVAGVVAIIIAIAVIGALIMNSLKKRSA